MNLTVQPCMPADVANILLFLASDESCAITGQVIVADFGATLLKKILSRKKQCDNIVMKFLFNSKHEETSYNEKDLRRKNKRCIQP